MKRIEQLWESYCAEVVPLGARAVQITECRRAFYAGGLALFSSIMAMLDPGTEPTEADLNKLTEIENELKQFGKDVLKGKR